MQQSITPRVRIRDGQSYGYSWWINTTRTPPVFEAIGRGGQRAAAVPDKDLVVVFNGGGLNTDDLAPFLFRAIKSENALAENKHGHDRLEKALEAAREPPAPQPVAPLPAFAESVSGKRFVLQSNPLQLHAVSLTFEKQTAALVLETNRHKWSVPVGLDKRYRFSSTGPSAGPLGVSMAARGDWQSERVFQLDLNTIANINHFLIRMEFVGNQLHMTIDEATGELKKLPVRGRLQGS